MAANERATSPASMPNLDALILDELEAIFFTVKYTDDPSFPDLSSTKSAVHDGEVDEQDFRRIFDKWSEDNNTDDKVSLWKFKSILTFASKEYKKALCKTVVPRLVDLDELLEESVSVKTDVSGADGIVTILHSYDPNAFRKFLDLDKILSFTYVWHLADTSKDDPATLPFMITREGNEVQVSLHPTRDARSTNEKQFGYKVGFKHGVAARGWEMVYDFKILANGDWKVGSAGGTYNAPLATFMRDAEKKEQGLAETISASSGRMAISAMLQKVGLTCDDLCTVKVTYESSEN